MPWMKSGDNAATYPALMAVAGMEGSDERAVNEVAGFLWRASTLGAAHMTDYLVNVGTLYMLAGTRTNLLVEWCTRAGLLTEIKQDGIKSYSIIADPEFIHMRLKDEIEWERQQRSDTRDPRLTVPVRLRDGDNCRWCGVSITWRGRSSGRSGEYDHLIPGQAATIDTLVVACRSCNGARKGGTAEQLAAWEENHPLRPAPTNPRYGKATAKHLQDNGYPHIVENIRSDEDSSDLAAAHTQRRKPEQTPAAYGERRKTNQAAADVQRRKVDQAAHPQRLSSDLAAADKQRRKPEEPTNWRAEPDNGPKEYRRKFDRNSISHSDRMNFVGSGLDGSSQVGTGQGGAMPSWAGDTWPSSGSNSAGTTSTDGTGSPEPKRRRGRRGGNKR